MDIAIGKIGLVDWWGCQVGPSSPWTTGRWFWHQWKCVFDFLLVLNSNLGPMTCPVSEILQLFYAEIYFFDTSPLLRRFPFEVDPWWCTQTANTPGYLTVKLFSKNFPPMWFQSTNVRNGRTDDMLRQYREMLNVKMFLKIKKSTI